MVNTEYYGISNFDYTNFKSQREKYVDFIIFDNLSYSVSKMCMDKFNMHLEKYSECYKIDDLVAIKKCKWYDIFKFITSFSSYK